MRRHLQPSIAMLALALLPSRAAADRGGPDEAGREWVDSAEPDAGVAYEWLDISATGTVVDLGDAALSEAIPIGFNFEHYGFVYNQLHAGSDGYVTFLPSEVERFGGHCPLPATRLPNATIFGFYQDLDPSAETSGAISYGLLGEEGSRLFVVTFDGVDVYQGDPAWGSDPVTFQIVLYEASGEAQVNVQESGELGGAPRWVSNALIGMENDEGTIGVGTCPGTIPDGYAVRFRHSTGVGLFPASQRVVGTPGEATRLELELMSFGDAELEASVEAASDAGWATVVADPSPTLAAGGAVTPVVVDVTVAEDAAVGTTDRVLVTVTVGATALVAEASVVASLPSDSWQMIADLPRSLRDVALLSDDEHLYAIGGAYLDAESVWQPTAATYRYDADLNGWSDAAVSALPTPLTKGGACIMDGRIYYVGGFDGTAADGSHWAYSPDVYIYDIAADEWSTGNPPAHSVAAPLVVCDEATSSVFVLNGYTDLDGDGEFLTRSEGGADWRIPRTLHYDAEGDSWSDRTASAEGVTSAGVALIGTRIIVAGGSYDDEDPEAGGWVTRGTRIYDVVSDSWSEGDLVSSFRSNPASVVYDGRLCLIGGHDNDDAVASWECYAEPIWVEQPDPISVARQRLSGASLGDRIYVVGGEPLHGTTARSERWPSGDLAPPTVVDGDGDVDVDVDVDADADADGGLDGGGDGGELGCQDGGSDCEPCGCSCAASSAGVPWRSELPVAVLALLLLGVARRRR